MTDQTVQFPTPSNSARVTISGRLLHEARARAISDPTLTLSQAVAAEYENVAFRLRSHDELHDRIRNAFPEGTRPLGNGMIPRHVVKLAGRISSIQRESSTWRRAFIASAIATLAIGALALLSS